MFKTLELPGGFAPLAPYEGFALDPLGALSGPIPGYGPVIGKIKEMLRSLFYDIPCYVTMDHISPLDHRLCFRSMF